MAIEPMHQADILDVVQLERDSGLNSLGRDGFERQLARPGSILLVARLGVSGIAGSLSGWVVADEFQIDNVVVAAPSRRRGIGAALMQQGARIARALGAEKAVLEVRSANYVARVLYERLGFALVGRRPEYYRDPTDDALIMVCREGEWERLVA
ncbi:MAG: GNAT family N-acetyltransferase [Acidobacteriota bacterium]